MKIGSLVKLTESIWGDPALVGLVVDIVDKSISVTPKNLEKETRQLWGMSRSQIANIVRGVHTGFSKELEINA